VKLETRPAPTSANVGTSLKPKREAKRSPTKDQKPLPSAIPKHQKDVARPATPAEVRGYQTKPEKAASEQQHRQALEVVRAEIDYTVASEAQSRFTIALNHNVDIAQQATGEKRSLWIRYFSGSAPGKWREVVPLDWVRDTGGFISQTRSVHVFNKKKETKDVYRIDLVGAVTEARPDGPAESFA